MNLKPCDGTWQCYLRHNKRKERPCAESLKAWRAYVAAARDRQRKRGKNV